MSKPNKICKECGKEASSKSNFCGACGNDKFENITAVKSSTGVLPLMARYMLRKIKGYYRKIIIKLAQNISTTEANNAKEDNI